MAKRFKLRISRVFQSCRSKDPSSLTSNPVPSFLRLSPVNHTPITVHFKQNTPFIKRHVSSVFGCGGGFETRSTELDHTESLSPPPDEIFQWKKDERFHVITNTLPYEENNKIPRRKIYTTENDDVISPERKKKKKRRITKKKRFRISTSSADSGLFTSSSTADQIKNSGAGEETETLMSSSRSFSSSSDEKNPNPQFIKTPSKQRRKVKLEPFPTVGSELQSSPARLSTFLQKLAVEGKVRESFAIVKKSKDPYGDFKRSMMEMILEKQMFEERDLEQLLHCFLSLNCRYHHGIIVQAFAEIWEVLFCNRRSTSAYCRISN